MKKISIVTPCFNEEDNVFDIYMKVKNIFSEMKKYKYEHVFIDNASTDKTATILKTIAKKDSNVKIIINTRNFGWIRSPNYALKQAYGDAVIHLVADFQDPPELIKDFIRHWEDGFKVVVGIKRNTEELFVMSIIRKIFYHIINSISDVGLLKDFTGYGLYDKKFIDIYRTINDPYPYFRGLISEIGFDVKAVYYKQLRRRRGITSSNFYRLYDVAMLGFVNHSKVPLRLSCFIGFLVGILSLIVAFVYFVYKIIFWDKFNLGMAPLVIGLFFFASIQLFFIGIIGEYIGAIYTQVKNKPLVIEKERINFD
jgi:glycosyltransferase involved in cell wall biosynthesis